MNVLSLFDGMSCGQIALDQLGVKIDNYFACEVDKYAIKATMTNYPNTIQLGDVCKVDAFNDLPIIDLVIGGSPCQGFSLAGKQLAFEDPRSQLFFEYVRILGDVMKRNPNVKFLLENVKMKKEYLDAISRAMGVEPICINSALVSAQNRVRYYWTNIPGIKQPEDRGIMLRDILEDGFVGKSKSWCLLESYSRFPKKTESVKKRYARSMMPVVFMTKSLSFDDGWRALTVIEMERLQTVPDNYTSSVSGKQAMSLLGNGWTVEVIKHIFNNL